MFRRRTDQVYATLQQVQRRISQQTASGDLANEVVMPRGGTAILPPPAMPAPLMAPTTMPLSAPGAASDPLRQGPALGAPITAPMESAFQLPARRPSLSLPWEAASVLFFVWLGSLVGVFFFGRHLGAHAAQVAAGPRPQVAAISDNPAASASSAAPHYVLLLASVSKPTADNEARLRADAERLNRFAEQNRAHGYQPWFALRRSPDGSLQLVFGKTDEGFGIDKEPFAALAEALDRAGYRGARWVDE
jgi:hypothetical protein